MRTTNQRTDIREFHTDAIAEVKPSVSEPEEISRLTSIELRLERMESSFDEIKKLLNSN